MKGSASDFGRDHGLIHEAVITGRKAGWEANEWAKLAHDVSLMRDVRKVLIGTAAIVDNPKKAEKQPKLLKPVGFMSAETLAERHDPNAFYQTREGLYVYGDSQNRIVAAAKLTEAGYKFKKAPRFTLGQNATGQELRDARPKGTWQATEFCAWLAIKIGKQKNGEAGELLNTGWANLFLVEGVNGEVFLVSVRWGGVRQDWYFYTWPLGHEWYAGCQFVPRN